MHVYIVYLGASQFNDPLLTSKHHLHLLSNVFSSEDEAKQSILYSYKHGLSGFSATLNSSQAAALASNYKAAFGKCFEKEGVISVFKSKTLNLHTTRSWDFLGLSLDHSRAEGVMPLHMAYGDDIIVGIVDTGIWPESDSFREELGLGPIPRSWKGKCVAGENFDPSRACNRKLIGARYYLKGFEQQYGPLNTSSATGTAGNSEYRSPRDFLGHGTHTASTAVGSLVRNASFFGLGRGTARGGAPRARLAVYKCCWNRGFDGKCSEADILSAFDDALHDGVHVISASFGMRPPLYPFFASSSDIGSFHAMQAGVSVVFSAGNGGPQPALVENVNPWSISVAASTIDRTFPTRIVLDNHTSFVGESLIVNQIRGRLAGASTYFIDGTCKMGNLRNRTAAGRVILCFSTVGGPVISGEAEIAAWTANASGLIFVEPLGQQVAEVNILPVIHLDIIQGTKMAHYLAESPRLPAVQILPSATLLRKSPAPVVADFSSRGPSSISPDILKPDISAPGINILAAWPPQTAPTLFPRDERRVNWNFESGTSMSCPHVAGVVALLKSAHPHWSPAIIRSALMTTAYTADTTHDTILDGGTTKPFNPFDIGSGHIDPTKAMDPGLVYDTNTNDYILFLCGLGYTPNQIQSMLVLLPLPPSPPPVITCLPGFFHDMNYPSITVSNLRSMKTVKRRVKNVDTQKKVSMYFVNVVRPSGVEVVVWPRVLVFTCFVEERFYYVRLRAVKRSVGRYGFGEIVWSDGRHRVRTPLVVLVNTTTSSSTSLGHHDTI